MWWLIIFLPCLLFFIKARFYCHFSCTKHTAMTPLPIVESCSWQRHGVIIYLAQNNGAKKLSQPGGWETLGWDNISWEVQILGTDLSRGWIIECNTTLREGWGNPIRVSKICNPHRGLPSHGCIKSWTRWWDFLIPPSMWWLIIFLILSINV